MCYFQFNTIKFSKNVHPFSDASKSLKIFRRRSEGAAEGGCGGNCAVPERLSPAACSVRSRSQRETFQILPVCQDAKSAKTAGREVFVEMMAKVEKSDGV